MRVPKRVVKAADDLGSRSWPDAAWRFAIRQGYVEAYQNDPDTLPDLVDALDDAALTLEESRPFDTQPSTSSGEQPLDARRRALSEILAIEASRLPYVQHLRRELLGGRFVGFEAIDDWIADQAANDGPATVWLTHPADEPPDGSHTDETQLSLAYVSPQSRFVRSVAVRLGGVLDEIRVAADTLHRDIGWQKHDAATFLLTDRIPFAAGMRWTKHHPLPRRPGRQRITLDIAVETKPADVADLYRRLREELLNESESSKPRALTAKTGRLAVHAARHQVGFTWREAMGNWNREHTNDAYSDEAQFTRDSRSAYTRVTGQPLTWVGRTEPEET